MNHEPGTIEPGTWNKEPGTFLFSKFLHVLLVRSRQQVEERIEAAIHCAAQLRNRAVNRMKRHAR